MTTPTSWYRDRHVREAEHEENGGVENDVSLLSVLTHNTHVDCMTLRDPLEQHRHALVADVRIRTGALLPKR